MGIPSGLLNKTVTIKRAVKTYNNTGDITNSKTTVASVSCRINRQSTNDRDTYRMYGQTVISTHKGFFNSSVDLQSGDFIIDGDNTYWVADVNSEPGGKIGHHQEAELVKENIGD